MELDKIKNFFAYLSSFIFGGMFIVGLTKILDKYNEGKGHFEILSNILNYKIHEPNNLTISKILILIFVLVIGVKISKIISYKIVHKIVNPTQLNQGTKSSIENLSYYFFICLSILVALNIAEVPLTIFTLFGGALAIGLGFGSQNIVSNFIGGIILQIEQPVKVGDIIEMEGNVGTIENIGGLRTKIISGNNTHLIVPNTYLLDKQLVNWTYQNNIVRCKTEIRLPYSINHKEFADLVNEVIKENEHINSYPEPRIVLSEFGEYAIHYNIFFWVPVYGALDRMSIEGRFRVSLHEKLRSKGIVIPIQKMRLETLKKEEI